MCRCWWNGLLWCLSLMLTPPHFTSILPLSPKWNDLKWQSRNAMIHFMTFLSHIYRFWAFFHSLSIGLVFCLVVPKIHLRTYLHVKTLCSMIDACFIGLSVCHPVLVPFIPFGCRTKETSVCIAYRIGFPFLH